MFTGDNLSLKQINVSKFHEWSANGNGGQLCFLVASKGKGRYEGENNSFSFESGDLLILSKRSGGKVSSLEKPALTIQRFLLSIDQLGLLLGFGEIGLLKKIAGQWNGGKHYPASTPTAQQCLAAIASTPDSETLEHRSHLLKIAATILSQEFKVAENQLTLSAGPNPDFARVINRLSLDDVLDLSVEELANKLGYSRRHLNRMFREYLGISVSALKMEARMLKALFRLQDSSVKVIDVAMECGFNHLGLFSQCFKRRFDLSPNQWRQQKSARQGNKSVQSLVHHDCTLMSSGMCLWSNLQQSPVEPKA